MADSYEVKVTRSLDFVNQIAALRRENECQQCGHIDSEAPAEQLVCSKCGGEAFSFTSDMDDAMETLDNMIARARQIQEGNC